MALTETAIRAAKPREKEYTLSDGDGLLLAVRTTGSKRWILRYYVDGKEKRAGLGSYPEVGLADARDLRFQFKRELALGGNPQERKKAEREATAKEERAKAMTFARVAEDWFSQRSNAWSAIYSFQTRSKLVRYAFPAIGERPVREITSREILALLQNIEQRTTIEARKTKQIIGQVLRFAIARGDLEYDMTFNLRGALKSNVVRHYSALTRPDDIKQLMRSFGCYAGSPVVQAALWFSLHTFQRPGEIMKAEWAEIDVGAALWRLPAERMKMRREHLVPLSRQVLELLEKVRILTGKSCFVFASLHGMTKPMNSNAVRLALRSLGYGNDEMCAHGFRALASTNLHEQGWDSALIELSLAHVDKNSVRAAYNHAERLEERRKMMQAWSDWIDSLKD
jgi:integrase